MNLSRSDPGAATEALTTIFLRGVAIIGSDLDVLQPWATREKVLDRYTLVLGQCLNDTL